jgi:hypothetical protein
MPAASPPAVKPPGRKALRVLAVIAENSRLRADSAADNDDPVVEATTVDYLADAVGRKGLRRRLRRLKAARLIQVKGGGWASPTRAGWRVLSDDRAEPVPEPPAAAGDTPPPGRPPVYCHLQRVPALQLEGKLNTLAAGGWRVVACQSHWSNDGPGGLFYWVVLEARGGAIS